MTTPKQITAAIWNILHAAIGKDQQSRTEAVQGLHQIAVAATQALAMMEHIAPEETHSLCRVSTIWPKLISPMNESEAIRQLEAILLHLGKDTGFDGISARRSNSDAAFTAPWYYVLESERKNHLWEYLSDYDKAPYVREAKDGQTPEECFAEFKAVDYPQREKQPARIAGEDLRWTYAAGLLGPLTRENAGEWAMAATLYLESLSPEGDLMRCQLVPQVVIDPRGLREANRDSNKDERRHAEETARKDTFRALKRKLQHGFEAIAWNS